jgi:hypothetical protein
MTNRTEKQAHDLAAVGFALLERRRFHTGPSELSMSDLVALYDAMKAHESQAAMLAALPTDKLQAARELNPVERPSSRIYEGEKPCPECGSRECNGECMGDGLMGG